MSKNKVVPLKGGEQHEDENKKAIKAINDALKKIDDHHAVFTPDLIWFEQLIIQEKEKARKKLVRDLLLFWMIAFLITGVLLFSFFQIPAMFIIIQGLATLSLPLIGIWQRKKRMMSL